MLVDESVAGASPLSLDLQPGDIAIYGCFMPHRSTFASEAAAAWAFGAIELTTASTLLGLGGQNNVKVIDDPTQLKSEVPDKSTLRLAGLGGFATPAGSGVVGSFRF